MRMHEQGHTQSDMDDFERLANEKWIYVACSNERAYHNDQYKVVQPYQGGDSHTVKDQRTLETGKHYQIILSTRC